MNINVRNISVIDFNKICRICMSEGNLRNIFNNCESENCIFEMLSCCTLTMVSEKDELPDKICVQCLSELKVAYKFYQKSEVSDTRLHKLLDKFKQAAQVNSSKIQVTNLQTVMKNKLDPSTIENDATVSLKSDIAVVNNLLIDHDYIMPEQENSPPNVLNSNETTTDTDQATNISNTSTSCTNQCTKCLKTGFTYRELRIHWMTVHGAKYAERECEVCKKFIGYKDFKQHVRSHSQYRPFACDLCDAKFKAKPHLLSHKVTHLSVKPHFCNICNKRFTRLETLRKHVEKQNCTANLPRPEGYLCRVCNRFCPTKASLYQHSLIHGDKKFLCWFCGKNFTTGGGLLTHVKRHTGVRPHKCSYCPKSFIQSNALKIHTYSHTGERPYICEFCSKSFSQIQHLKLHIRGHTGVKPHKCSHCEKCYATGDRLKVHMRTHTGERPYVCEECGKGFHDRKHWRRHLKIHARMQNKMN